MTENGTLTCENAIIKGTLYSENGDDKVYLRNGKMQIFFRNQELGLIGGNGWHGSSNIEGLNFDLEVTGDYMTWAAQKTSDGTYYAKLTYARSSFDGFTGGALNAGCDLDMHRWTIRNAELSGISSGGYIGWSGTIPIVTKIQKNSNGGISWWFNTIKVSNGIILSAPSEN